jgi:glutamate racemase
MTKSQAIGVFDSGIGGLTVVKAIESLLPLEQIIYVGDTQHMPYGDKSPEHIKSYCKRIVDFLLTKDVKMIVIACNTASSVAASYLRSTYWEQVEIMGVIRPAILSIIEKKYKKIGIIGTQGTIQSNIYPTLFQEYHSDVELFQLATPLLAPMIEQGLYGNKVSKAVLDEYLKNDQFQDKEAILLACTHYPLIKNEVDAYFNHTKDILDNAEPMAKAVKKYLYDKNLLSETKLSENQFYVTEYTQNFEETSKIFHGSSIQIEAIDIHHEF